MRKIGNTYDCKLCGTDFVLDHSNRVYCGETCASQVIQVRTPGYLLKFRDANREKLNLLGKKYYLENIIKIRHRRLQKRLEDRAKKEGFK